ncbi:hypothetical protein PPL_09685 [Heterostelium album PN500]|uniref:Uncharacterized protein n=1 Tax=Heterostelium pallidum (strain ATCC 26659 / Pp 5 / PN500) TaxID=670386 RepID=D3BNI2_HETP5|nr:hypothetical protein PPL_09685 [Heterostelium album PN500]EFA76933.1 hypothetical protein PPL_09685 [Heterostelium album PN500]|eukprot:XP_020429065.1 hypothetical protein PPL_09685 [Heterostelium album PN500]
MFAQDCIDKAMPSNVELKSNLKVLDVTSGSDVLALLVANRLKSNGGSVYRMLKQGGLATFTMLEESPFLDLLIETYVATFSALGQAIKATPHSMQQLTDISLLEKTLRASGFLNIAVTHVSHTIESENIDSFLQNNRINPIVNYFKNQLDSTELLNKFDTVFRQLLVDKYCLVDKNTISSLEIKSYLIESRRIY